MSAEDLKRIAERYTELMNPGTWHDLTDAQKAVALLQVVKAVQAALMEGFLMRKSAVKFQVAD